MYGKKTWDGPVDPFILIKYLDQKEATDDAISSLIVFEWKDRDLVGIATDDGYGRVSAEFEGFMDDELIEMFRSVLPSAPTTSSRPANARKLTLENSSSLRTQPTNPTS